jgi:hypothetical protein
LHAGILEYETKELLIQHITREHCYSLDYLNQQITGPELGFMESRDRPSLISISTLQSKDHKLKQEGMEVHVYTVLLLPL